METRTQNAKDEGLIEWRCISLTRWWRGFHALRMLTHRKIKCRKERKKRQSWADHWRTYFVMRWSAHSCMTTFPTPTLFATDIHWLKQQNWHDKTDFSEHGHKIEFHLPQKFVDLLTSSFALKAFVPNSDNLAPFFLTSKSFTPDWSSSSDQLPNACATKTTPIVNCSSSQPCKLQIL